MRHWQRLLILMTAIVGLGWAVSPQPVAASEASGITTAEFRVTGQRPETRPQLGLPTRRAPGDRLPGTRLGTTGGSGAQALPQTSDAPGIWLSLAGVSVLAGWIWFTRRKEAGAHEDD